LINSSKTNIDLYRHLRYYSGAALQRQGATEAVKKINPFNTAYDQYRKLTEKAQSTDDIQEKNLIFRRRINLLGVMQFLLSEPKASN